MPSVDKEDGGQSQLLSSDLPKKTLLDLVDRKFDYFEPEKWNNNEPRVKLSTDPTLPVKIKADIPEELARRLEKWNFKEFTIPEHALKKVLDILEKYPEVFSKDEFDLGCFTAYEHSIDTGDNPPIKAKPRPMSRAKLECLKEILDEL